MPARVQLPYLIQDRQYLRRDGDVLLATPIQYLTVPDDGSFMDGPVHPRLAVIDLDAASGRLRQGVRLLPRGVGKSTSSYDLKTTRLDPDSAPEDFETDAFLQVSPFATALKTLAFFESPEILGRPVAWAFPSSQLLIVPRAGEMKNAFYDRESGSLQFFYHPSAEGFTIFTALSHDIIVHETTHAILDGLAPDLYHATSPQSLALHEALADLSAITQTLLNEMVVFSLGAISAGDINPLEALSRLAEEFGTDTRQGDGASFLRRLKNNRTLRPDDTGIDEFGVPNRPDPSDPHALSQVLSGAIYTLFEGRMQSTPRGEWASLEEVFCPAARHVARIVFRALDYLPPGEASFADYGRAFLAAASATYQRPQAEQELLVAEYVRRGIVANLAELAAPVLPDLQLTQADVDRLIYDSTARRQFAESHRLLLNIPAGIACESLEPVRASRRLGSSRSARHSTEVILRFRWQETQSHDLGPEHPAQWSVTRGTTLVITSTGQVLSLLTTDPGVPSQRTALLKRWIADGRLLPEDQALGPDGSPLAEAVLLKMDGGIAHAEGGGRTLHLARDVL